MTLKFHESLERLVGMAAAHGVPLDEKTVFVRDGVGRLTVVREELTNADTLTIAAKQTLGAYASIRPVVSGPMALALVKDRTARIVDVPSLGPVRFIDRRFVGADWLSELQTPSEIGPRRLVFSSLKGGVGRSTALTVLAADLARHGKKVLAIDLDLEAPGIGFMLLEESADIGKDRRPKYGVLDYLVENGLGGIADEEFEDFIGVSSFVDGSIDVIPVVGRVTDEHPEAMLAKLSRAFIEDQSDSGLVSFARQIREMVDRFAARKNYDAVLIDARAGLADSNAAALLGLGGEVLFFGIDQPQTFRGYRYLFAHLLENFGASVAYDDWRRHVSFVQAKAPAAPSKRSEFRESLYDLCSDYFYDEETLEDDGRVEIADFNFSVADTGDTVPHDASYVTHDADYVAFDPCGDRTQLDPDVYSGPFRHFLDRGWALLNLSRDGEF